MYSDSTITDEPLVQQTDEILNADDEDAHLSTDTVDSADEDESAGSASQQITDDETVQEDLESSTYVSQPYPPLLIGRRK